MIGTLVFGALLAATALVATAEPEAAAEESAVDAEPESLSELDLRWVVPEGDCPGSEGVQTRIEDVLGRPLGPAKNAPLVANAIVTKKSANKYALVVETRSEAGQSTQSFSGSSCSVLVDAAALIVASALDPEYGFGAESVHRSGPAGAGTSGSESESESVHRSGPAGAGTSGSESEPESESESESESEPGPRIGGSVRVGSVGQLGLLPGPSIGLDAALAVRFEYARIEARFGSAFARSAGSADRPGAGAQIGLWTLGLHGCWTPRVKIVEFPVCGGMLAGQMSGSEYGVDGRSTTRVPFVAGDVGVAIAVSPWPWLSFWLGPDLVVPITRPVFSLGDERLHRVSPVAGSVVVGVEGRFGGVWPSR
jgi:hypothetical protein